MSLIDSMQRLKNDIKSSRQKRREETRELKKDTHRMLADAERTRKEEADREKRELTAFIHDLTDDVVKLRREFRQEQAEVRKEIMGAAAVWHGRAKVAVKEEKKEKKQKD